ncbi:hypothetical protein GCK72_003438 [Caenorhabditis remanei]|uniref:PAN-3 domain-containing protein n=1 Tax=Caenorhabditis remanei TaxID=31234 RepID=A0A6A5HWF6_CAERE|nr:hypothetical protein GCK72_003438 [Caenorhabditis remanei]KAF1771611.1 hypothetical protein GCK72_003438 [Caenorhabditis remanei]
MKYLLLLFGIVNGVVNGLSKLGTCGNFTDNRPYPDGCNPECDVTMVQVNAIPGPLSTEYNNQDAKNWNDCMYACHGNLACFATYFNPTVGCRWWNIYKIWFFNRTEAQNMQGAHMAIKIPLSPVSCKYTTEQLLDDKYYLPYNRILASVKRGFFRMRTTPKYYKFSAYVDEKFDYKFTFTGCEFGTLASATQTHNKQTGTSVTNEETLMCVGLVNAPNITQVAANELCHEMDGKLMTERHAGFINDGGNCGGSFSSIMLNTLMYPDYGTKFLSGYKNPEGYKIWFGLEKTKYSQSFKWQAPEWSIVNRQTYKMCSSGMPWNTYVNETINKVQFTWGPGQPKMASGLDCGYMHYKYQSPYPGYSLKTARCDDVADIFACGHETQAKKGIPPFQKIADEYGYGGRNFTYVEKERGFWQYLYYNGTDIKKSV